jgi:hypothetical protein
MWLFTRYGFYSVACAQTGNGALDPQMMMIRARSVAHLLNLQRRFLVLADLKIVTLPDRDYRSRLIVPKENWIRIMAELAEEQEWSNFKNEVDRFQGRTGQEYVHALHSVWSVMSNFQDAETRLAKSNTRPARGSPGIAKADRDVVQRLVAYLPKFEEPGLIVCTNPGAKMGNGVITISQPEYIPEVNEFFEIAALFADRDYPRKPVGSWLEEKSFIERANPGQLRTVLTWICRRERFCYGSFWQEQFKNGNVVRVLCRLRILLAEDGNA